MAQYRESKRWRYRDIDREDVEDLTREDIPEGEINWENWNRIVQETRKQIAEYVKNSPVIRPFNKSTSVYAYNSQGELVNQWESMNACTVEQNTSKATISFYSKNQYVFKEMLLSNEQLTKDKAFALYRDRITTGKVYLAGGSKLSKPIYSYDSTGNMVGVFQNQNVWSQANKTHYKKFKGEDIVFNDRLVSHQYYDKQTAQKKYQSTATVKARHNKGVPVYCYNSKGELIHTDISVRSYCYRMDLDGYRIGSLKKQMTEEFINKQAHLVSFKQYTPTEAADRYFRVITSQSRKSTKKSY